MTSIGIITFSNQKYEWMIPWWTHHLQKNTTYPISYIDNGMSESMKNWCDKRGSLISFSPKLKVKPKEFISKKLQIKWESVYFGDVWALRPSWFVKPEVLMATPFDTTLYLDLDCEVIKPLDDLIILKPEFALCKEGEREACYNSGVILFQKNNPILHDWYNKSIEENHLYMGDEDILSEVIKEKKSTLTVLDTRYNCRPKSEKAGEASIIHRVGVGGKRDIMATILETF